MNYQGILASVEVADSIDWGRMAKPSGEGYDSQIILKLARIKGYRRRPVDVSFSIFENSIAIRTLPSNISEEVRKWCKPGPLQHPNFGRAERLLKKWEEGYSQFMNLMDSLYPIAKVKISPEAFPDSKQISNSLIMGSSSHSDEDKFGTMYCTIYDPIGTAQSFVHELAHQKLRALGVQVEKTDFLIANSSEALYESPVRKDKLRPMSAVVHATYAWLHIAQLDLILLENAKSENMGKEVETLFTNYLYRKLVPLADGIGVMKKHLIPDEAGEAFFESIYTWAHEVYDKCREYY